MESVTSFSSLKSLANRNRYTGLDAAFMSCSMLLAALIVIIPACHLAGMAFSAATPSLPEQPFCNAAASWPGAALLCFGPIEINGASLEELDQLPGVGAHTAAKLINFRMLRGFLLSADEISEAFDLFDHRFEYLSNFITTKPDHDDKTVGNLSKTGKQI